MTKVKWLIGGTATAFALFLVYVIFCAITKQDVFFLRFIRSIPYGDKIGHVCLMGTMTFLLNLALLAWRGARHSIRSCILLGCGMVATIITLEECSQAFIPTRSFDLLDLSANYLGILLAGMASFPFGKTLRAAARQNKMHAT
jgi:VanZ family protein